MKQNIGKLSEADLKARRRFWNKKGFFGEPAKKLPKYAIQNIRANTSRRIYTQFGTLANQISITQ